MRNLMTKATISLSLLITITMSSLFQIQAQAATPQKDDFAYLATLSEAQTSLRQLDLPKEVYAKMYRQDYGDLRIFSADGQAVPHQFSRSESQRSTQIKNLNFYPFNREQARDAGNISIEINQNTGKQQLKINQSLSRANANTSEYQYIIENTPIESKQKYSSLCKLKLYWQQSKPSLILGLKLESSDDLQQWRSLSRKLNVSRLKYAKSQLVRDEIEFNCSSEPYLRLTWLNEDNNADAGVHLNSIQGFYTQENTQQSQWQTLTKPRYDDDGNWLFESTVVAALAQMVFVAPQNGLLYKGRLYSRNTPQQSWRYRDQITQYRLNLGEGELQSNPFSLGSINDRYWKFESLIETQFTQAQLPEIKAAWRSNKLLFIAQGAAPFTLAFGNPTIQPAKNSDLNSLIESLKQSGSTVDSVTLTNIVAGEQSFSRDGKTNWKKFALWFVLLLGTLMMAFMAYRLYQQMGSESKE